MNKKFSTLVAALMLATSVGTYAADYTSVPTKDTKYKAGKAYLLKVKLSSAEDNVATGDAYLSVDATGKTSTPKLVVKALEEKPSLSAIQKALWEVKVIPADPGAISPKFVLTNRYTGTVLAIDKDYALAADKVDEKYDADKSSNMGGNVFEWLVQTPSEAPVENSFYVAYGSDDKIIVLTADDRVADNKALEVYGKIVKASELATAGAIDFTPVEANPERYLSANELNTQFGVNGVLKDGEVQATINNFFKLGISPAVSEGQKNVFNTELQARAVERWEVQYGTDHDVITYDPVVPANADRKFISMYPEAKGASSADDKKNQKYMTAYRSEETTFALYSKVEDQYIVVDTSYIKGTEQVNNGLIDFAYDKLYNAKNETRYRLPQSYLFQFKYDASNNKITVVSQGYVTGNLGDKQQVGDPSTDDAVFYAGTAAETGLDKNIDSKNDYSVAPVLNGAQWASASYKNAEKTPQPVTVTPVIPVSDADVASGTAQNKVLLNYAKLANTIVLTLAPKTEDDFKVTADQRSNYQLTNLAKGVYLFKVVGVANPDYQERIGKYWAKTLNGNSEYAEQASRQDFQEMPATQWVVENAGVSTSYAPIKINNREFNGKFDMKESNTSNEWVDIATSGLLYTAGGNKVFFFGGDTLEYTPVAKQKVDTLGYKYISEIEEQEAVYTFNYLHELAMDKPINTKSDKDSVVWVDKDGQAMKFQLERVQYVYDNENHTKVLEDTYGYNADSKDIAQLKRLVYKIRVKDASKLQNDRRYLSYNSTSKKYNVTTGHGTEFFLKVNNTAEHVNYYTLLEANISENIMPIKELKESATVGTYDPFEISGGKVDMVTDADIENYVLSAIQDAVDADGLNTPNWQPIAFDSESKAKAFSYMNTRGQVIKTTDNKWYVVYTNNSEDYASSKVSVDNNTLDLVYGVLDNNASSEVANSAFSTKKDDSKLYRTIGDVEGENAKESVLNFFRTKSTEKEYLYEDANSSYSKGLGMSFLGVEGKGDAKNTAMFVKYTHGTRMPQYLIAVDTTVFAGTEYICPECGLATCEHSKVEKAYMDGRFLINLIDSVNYYRGASDYKSMYKYMGDKKYTRLAFVDARLMGDSLIINNSAYTGNTTQMNGLKDSTTWASKDTINLSANKHNPALFSFRLYDDSNNFMIESESWNKDNNNAFAGEIAPTSNGGWVKIHNGIPVIVKAPYTEAYEQAEKFNVETTKDAPTSNEGINATEVSIVAGNGNVTIKNAEGKNVAISNILGQSIANTVISSDHATITVPAGIVIVSVEGEEAVKAIVK